MKISNIYDQPVTEGFFGDRLKALGSTAKASYFNNLNNFARTADFQIPPEYLAAYYFNTGKISNPDEVNKFIKSYLTKYDNSQNEAFLKDIAVKMFPQESVDYESFINKAQKTAPPKQDEVTTMPQQAQATPIAQATAAPTQAQPAQAPPSSPTPRATQPTTQNKKQTAPKPQPEALQWRDQVKSQIDKLFNKPQNLDDDMMFSIVKQILTRYIDILNGRSPRTIIMTPYKSTDSGYTIRGKKNDRKLKENEYNVRKQMYEITKNPDYLNENMFSQLFRNISLIIDYYNKARAQTPAVSEAFQDYARSITDPKYQRFLSKSETENNQEKFLQIRNFRNTINSMINQYINDTAGIMKKQNIDIKDYAAKIEKFIEAKKYHTRGEKAYDIYKRSYEALPERPDKKTQSTRPHKYDGIPQEDPDWSYGGQNAVEESNSFFNSKNFIFDIDWE